MKPFTDQFALTVIAPIEEVQAQELKETLAAIQQKIETNPILPFKQIPGIHFARFVLLDAYTDASGSVIPAQLAYSSNFDGSLSEHLHQITSPPVLMGFHRVFSGCVGFDHAAPPARAVEKFILKYQQKIHTYYRGHRGMSVSQIKDENAVRNVIQAYLDVTPLKGESTSQLKQQIEAHVAQQMPNWKPPETVKLTTYSLRQVALFAGLALLVLIGISFYLSAWLGASILLFFAGSALYLRHLEKTAQPLADGGKNFDKIQELSTNEDKIIQNQLTHLVPLQAGVFRRTVQQIALWALNTLARYTYNQGRLGDIGTIHFARWLLIDGGRRLLFFSNFDGSWENYLGDFVDRSATGLTLAWSNTQEFPRTKWLVTEGATDEELFKTWTRNYQLPTQVWYSGYRDLTVKNILRNRAIALGLYQPMTDAQTAEWLNLL
ncbi:MAG: hypothetical protein H7Y12_04670 [Sphingobacteriaceae bacterium]|nr:hypothetical protein [Cytophagaceae bacterium]